jgi:RHS repeat-associated protein
LGYDRASRVSSITHDLATDIVHSYTYDNESRVTSFDTTGPSNATRGYNYDNAGQLTSKTGSSVESYEYDDNGNRESVNGFPVATGLGNRLTDDGTYTYQYDNEGNRTKRTLKDDTALTTEYVWDHRNRLMSVIDKSGTTVTQSIVYTYDAQGRRVKRMFDANGAVAGGVSNEYFVYDGDELSMRFNNSQQLTHRYLNGPAVDQVLVDEVFAAGVGGQRVSDEVLWLLSDHQNTVRDVADANGTRRKHVDYGDSFGQIAGSQYYDAFGQIIEGTDPASHPEAVAVDQLFYYTGREWDKEAQLQNNRGRWYDPATGRWLSEDTSGFDGGDPNLYRYVGNSPLNFTDPTGLVQAGNPLTNLFAGGYTGGKVTPYKPPSTAIASGFKAVGNAALSAGVSLVNNVYSAGRNLANNYNEISSLYSQANTLTGQINAVANQRANPGWFGKEKGTRLVLDEGAAIG